MSREAPQLYARAAPRLQALLRDSLVQVGIMTACMTAAVVIGTPMATRAMVITFIAIVLLYEPVCITLAGGTIGHVSQNLRVVRATDLGPVSFGRALLRTVVKGLIGIWVFITVYVTPRSQAVHDLVAGTVVVPRNAVTVQSRGFALEKA
jgi:uncharacterized RDD family membrane protein YckC